jgi:hypothetical protein
MADPALGTLIFHAGGIDGYTTMAMYFVDEHASIVSMLDDFDADVDLYGIVDSLAAILFPTKTSATAPTSP